MYVDTAKCYLHTDLANQKACEKGDNRANKVKRRKTTETQDEPVYCLTPVGVLNVKKHSTLFSLHIYARVRATVRKNMQC